MNMLNVLLGFVIGIAVLAAVSLAVLQIYMLISVSRQIKNAIDELRKVATVFEKSADMAASMTGLVLVNRKMISSIESMTAAVRVFTGLVLKEETVESAEPPAPSYTPKWSQRPPSPFMQPDEPGSVISQSDEEMAELEKLNEVRQRGDVSEEDILAQQTQDQIRGEV